MAEATAPFNLWRDDWLPIRTSDTELIERKPDLHVGLADLFTHAHQIEGIALAPAPAESALLRVLVAITMRLTGLDDPSGGLEQWQDRQDHVFDAGRFDAAAIAEYDERHADRFGLYDSHRPWMQCTALARQCTKQAGVGKLVVGRAAGNNHAWFSHDQDDRPRPATPTESIASLLTWLYYGPSGKVSARTINGRNASTTKAGPLRSTMSYFPWAADGNLHTTLAAAAPWPDHDTDPEADLTPWERNTETQPDEFAGLVRGPRSAMTARAQHAVLLQPDATGTATANAWISLAHTQTVPKVADPYTITQESKVGNRYERRADAARALWRDLDALLLQEPTGSQKVQRPPVFATALVAMPMLRVRALGFEQDGQVKDDQFVTALTPIALDGERFADDPDAPWHIGNMRVNGETAGQRLDMAVKSAWKHFVDAKQLEECAWSRDAAAAYWPRAEQEFWSRIDRGEYEGARRAFQRIAAGVFDEITARCGISSRGMKAAEQARVWLYGGPRRPGPNQERKRPKESAMHQQQQPERDWLAKERSLIRDLVSVTEDRAARKALRQGLRRSPEDAPAMHRYLVPVLQRHGINGFHAAYAVAAMIATPTNTPSANREGSRANDFGAVLATAVSAGLVSESGAETRLVQLTRLDQAGLIRQLPRTAVRAAAVMTVDDWAQLYADLHWWHHRRKATAMRWLRSFWRERNRQAIGHARGADDADTNDDTDSE